MMLRVCLAAVVLSTPASAATWDSFALRDNGSIPVWTVAGPLPNAAAVSHGKNCFGYYKDYLQAAGGERRVMPTDQDRIVFDVDKQVAWKQAFSDSSGLLDLIDIFTASKNAPGVAYAFCRLDADKDQKIVLKVRSNDGVRIWLNDTLIHDQHVGRTIEQAEDSVAANLQKGPNRLLVKVGQSGGDWGLLLRVVAANGAAVEAVRASVSSQNSLAGRIVAATLSGSPVALRTPEGPRQAMVADICSGGLRNVTCRMQKAEGASPRIFPLGDLPPGRHRIEFQKPVLAGGGPLRIWLESATDKMELPNVSVAEPRQWTVYLVQHVHTDIGYTRPQTEILPEHLRYIDYALDYCDLTDDYPDDARFRWTCEITWAVREYLKRRPQAQIERLKQRVAEGRIEVAGMFLNMAEIATESSLAASLQPIRQIERELGADVRTAMQNDVNGAAWCLPDFFHGIGLEYFVMGSNKTRSLLPFDLPVPFWWESPSGKRVMALRAEHYHTGNFWKIHDGDLVAFQRGLIGYLRSLEDRDYPFDCVSIQYSGYHTDNSPPAMKPCDMIRAWNERYAWPKLRSAVAHEFLDVVRQRHADELPVHRQAWPDWWTDGFGSAARETAASRATHVAVDADQTLLAMAALLGGELPASVSARTAAVQEDLLFYDEHTYGAAESISDPMAENSMVQWAEKSAYVWEAVKHAGLLREEALGVLQPFLPRDSVATIAVFNTLAWQRSGLVKVFVDHEILPSNKAFRIVDPATGQALSAQPLARRSEGTWWALWARDVPPLGYKSYRIEVANEERSALPAADSHMLENKFYRLTADPSSGGLASIVDKQTGRELVDPEADWTAGQLLLETLTTGRDFHRDGFERKGLEGVTLRPGVAGPIWKSFEVHGELDGCATPKGALVEVRLYELEKRIELHYTIRKLPLTRPEAIYVAFPFAWPDGQIVYEAQGGTVRPGRDQIPRTASDWQTVQGFLAVRSAAGQIVWGSDQAPLVQLGDLNLGKWQPVTQIDRPHVFSWVMNNYWFTNFRATQEGEFKWSYYLTSIADASSAAATRFGWSSRVPLIPRVLPPGKPTGAVPERSILGLDAPNIALVSAYPARYSDGIVLHLRELDGKRTTLRVAMPSSSAKALTTQEVNVLEEPLAEPTLRQIFAPFETKFLRLTRASAVSQ
jgi:hypothetical protein